MDGRWLRVGSVGAAFYRLRADMFVWGISSVAVKLQVTWCLRCWCMKPQKPSFYRVLCVVGAQKSPKI